MGKRRVKQQNISVIGLLKLAERYKKMDDVFVCHECQSTRWSHSAIIKTNKLNHKQRLSRVFYYVCLFVFLFFRVPFLYVLSSCSF